MQNTTSKKRSTVTLVYMAMFIALNMVLTRVLGIPMGPYRIAFGPVAIIMAGLWLGPVCGGICGLLSDVLGCFVSGYAPNPLITISAILWGVIPGLSDRIIPAAAKKGRAAAICLSIALSGLIGSIGFTTAGLVLILGYNFYAIFPGRVVQTAIIVVLYSLICCTLYFSPLTSYVRRTLYAEPVRI